MIQRHSRPAAARFTALVIAIACAAGLLTVHALSAQAKPVPRAAAAKPYSVKIVNQIFGSDGAKGSFSVTLGPTAQVLAGLASVMTGIPYGEIARGGTFRAKDAPSSRAGLALVRFSDHALGTVCVRWNGTSGKYDPSKGYLPVDGSLTVVGGTGAAAHWRGSLRFTQTGLTGRDTLEFEGLPRGTIGAGHGLTAACRAVATLKG